MFCEQTAVAIPSFPAGLVSRNGFAPSYLGSVVLVQTAFIEGVSQCQGLWMSVAVAAGVAIKGAECAAEDTALSPEQDLPELFYQPPGF